MQEYYALYALVRNEEGEGIEVLVAQDSSLTACIRYIPKGAELALLVAKKTMKQLERSWQRAWDDLGLDAPDDLRQRLMVVYEQPHRHYHSLQHLQECIVHFETAMGLANHPSEVEMALWFHDAIYDPHAKDNEQRSADWAVAELTRQGVGAASAQRVHALIMATCHRATPSDPDQQLLVDIDLSILGASPARFAEYDAQVRAEYDWVETGVYQTKRKTVLKGFLDRPTIYSTAFFRERYEQQARANLQRLIG
jgi:predicted metal-dependent HD superfamily phosphohydrolase